MTFEEKLRRVCEQCTESTIVTYMYNIRALAKLAGHGMVPPNERWVNKALLEKVKKLSLTQYKKFTIAGQKALQAYGKPKHIWKDAVREASDQYSAKRNKQKRTEKEAANWPEGGYKAMKKLAETLHGEVEPILEEAPSSISQSELYRLQQWFIITFYANHALRGDLAEVKIEKRGQNYLHEKNGKWHMHIGVHKTVKAHGAIDFVLAEPVQEALKQLLPFVKAKTNHGYLLTTKRTGQKLSRRDMLKMLRNLTEERLGKRLGVQMIRTLRVTESAEAINETAKLRAELGHSAATQFQYVSK